MRITSLLATSWVVLALAGCLPDSGDRHAGLTVYDDPAGLYRVRYLAPPWEVPAMPAAPPGGFNLEIPSPYDAVASAGRKVYTFALSVEAQPAATFVPAVEANVVATGDTVESPTEAVQSDSGDAGFDLTWYSAPPMDYATFQRLRAYAVPTGSVVIQIVSYTDPRNQDIDHMLDAVDVLPGMPRP